MHFMISLEKEYADDDLWASVTSAPSTNYRVYEHQGSTAKMMIYVSD